MLFKNIVFPEYLVYYFETKIALNVFISFLSNVELPLF